MLDQLYQIGTRLSGYEPWALLVQFAIIWIVVYTVFRFLRGTRGARALKGVFFVIVLAMVTIAAMGSASDFAPLRFLLENFLGFVAIAMVIVFQPELRRALVRIGEARLFRGTNIETDSVIEEIVKAVEYLTKNKIGGIMAIEREVGLEGIVEAGTRMNADVSSALIKTIFWPGGALHDMGVVIRGDKLVAAGVQFPLADGADISQELGSRHRAAVGLSQEADCLVLVVSEETGAVSLAERGNLLRKLSVDGLRAMLRRGLSAPEDKSTAKKKTPDAAKPAKSNTSPRTKRTAADTVDKPAA